MYLDETIKKEEFVDGIPNIPFAPKFNKEEFITADRLEVWASSFSDKGEDFCEFRIMQGTKVLQTKTVRGY